MKSPRIFLISAILFCFYPLAVLANPATPEERARLEQELQQLENQVDQYEATIQDYRKQGQSLKGEIKKLNVKIEKINTQIKAVNLEIVKLDDEMKENQAQIGDTEKKLNFNRQALVTAIQSLYENENVSLVELLLLHPRLSDFFATINQLTALQDGLNDLLKEVEALRQTLLDKKEQLAVKRDDAEKLRRYRDIQKKDVEMVKDEKNNLLAVTKGQESQYQNLLKETQKTAAEIRRRIFQFLGGGELTFGDAYKLAKAAQEAVGVRASLILAVLDRESALGQNVGRCKYSEAMHPRRDTPLFLTLTAELNINPDSVTVSCANRDGAYGGAMGPAQFIPSTWNIYKNRVADLTGSRPASPWRNLDAFMATALYLKDAGADNVNSASQDRAAAARYYAGNRWRRYLWTYGERVVVKARQFDEDIAALLSN